MPDDRTIPLGRFPETQWSLVSRAARSGEGCRQATGELLRRYLPALKAHLVLRRGMDRHTANDLIQGFAADKVVEQDLLAHVTAGKGKFRTFLLTTFVRYVVSELRRQGAKKRSPGELLPIEAAEGAAAAAPDPFDLTWARDVLTETLTRMRAECEGSGRPDLWELFDCRILKPAMEQAAPLGYAKLAERFGFQSPTQASNAVITARRMFARCLRGVLAEYVADEAEVEAELGAMRRILAGVGAGQA